VCRRDGRDEPSSSPGERASADTGGERGASVLAEASPAVARGPAEAAPVPLVPPCAQHHWPTKVFGRPLPLCWMRPSRMLRSAALLLTDHSSRDSTRRLALEALKTFMSLTEAPASSFARCPLNLNSHNHNHNHNQHAGRPCFSLANLIQRSTSTLRYDISRLRNHITRQCACDSFARRGLIAASVNDGRTVMRPLRIERSTSDADDNRMALCALLISGCRFTSDIHSTTAV
jgi:hypothetical protein